MAEQVPNSRTSEQEHLLQQALIQEEIPLTPEAAFNYK